MKRNSILNKVNSDSSLMSLPPVVSEIIEITARDNYSTESLAKIISKDPPLAAGLLRFSNSTYYRRGAENESIYQAISMLGGNTVKCLALFISVLDLKRISAETGIVWREFLTYIISVATAAETIARAAGYENPEDALLAGLLHDIGVIYLLDNYGKEYSAVIQQQGRGIPLIDAEYEVFGITHAELGFNLALSWNLPGNIADSVARHHDVENIDQSKPLENIVKLSVLLVFDRFSDIGEDTEKRLSLTARIAGVLNIDSRQLAEITGNAISRMIEISDVLGIEVGNVEDLLARANREIWKLYLTIESLYKEREGLNVKISEQQRIDAALAARNEALSTLSHYLNNAIMIISGQSQLIGMMRERNQVDKLLGEIPSRTNEIKKSVDKIIAVMDVLKEVMPLGHDDYFNISSALNIDDRINEKLSKIEAG